MRVAAFAAGVATLAGTANAFWRMPCRGRTGLMRLDPIVDPGVASSHGHALHGGSNFAETTTYDMLRASECTSCQFTDDKSAYWTPSMHFVYENGTVDIVPQVGGMLAYYLLFGDNIKAFPEGFEMLAGDTRKRNFSGPVPDTPLSFWTESDKTQLALMEKSIGFNCLNYKIEAEGARYRHFLPDKAFMDATCLDGIRAELFFPSCWNGKDVTAEDHQSHMAYPSQIDGGECPEGFPVRLPSLFYETIWQTYAFKDQKGQFVFSHGDPTGYGYHGDFMMGWNRDVLQAAVDQCTDPTGQVEKCPIFTPSLQSEAEQAKCVIKDAPKVLKNENCAGPGKNLCGDVPIQYGPKYASQLHPGGGHDQPTNKLSLSTYAPVPTQSYAPARSKITDKYGGGVSVYNVKPSSAPAAAEVKPSVEPVVAADTKPSSAPAPAAAPVVTPAPAVDDGPSHSIVRTTTYTSDHKVYEIAINEVYVTVTEDEPAPTPAAKRHRRHAHFHRRDHEHGLLGRY